MTFKYFFKDSKNPADVVISSQNWFNRAGTAFGGEFCAAVELNKLPSGKFTVTLDSNSDNSIFDCRDKKSLEENPPSHWTVGRESTETTVELKDGDVFDVGIDSNLWTSEGDSGRKDFF